MLLLLQAVDVVLVAGRTVVCAVTAAAAGCYHGSCTPYHQIHTALMPTS